MDSRMHSMTVAVADQDASLDFYVNRLGWAKGIDRSVGPGKRIVTVFPPGASTQVVLAHKSWAGREATRRRRIDISLVAPDANAAYRTLVQRGVRFKRPLNRLPWGMKATNFYDPDGNEIALIEG